MTLECAHHVQAAPTHPFAPALVTRPDTPLLVAFASDRDFDDIVDEWGTQSFPASDPPANW